MKDLYRYVGITVVGLIAVIIVIRLFYLNTKLVEGLTNAVDTKRKEREDEEEEIREQQGTPLEKILSKLGKENDEFDRIWLKTILQDKEVTEDILLELDEICDKSILYGVIAVGQDGVNIGTSNGKPTLDSKRVSYIEQMMSLKKAVNQSMKYISNESSSSSGIFS